VKHHFENHDLVTERSSQLIDVTDELHAAVERADVENGMALVYSPHTTCAIVINEHESGFIDDFNELLAELAPEDGRYYRHDDLEIRTEGIEDDTGLYPNGHSHLRAGLLSSSSQTVPIVDGDLMLGRWQRIFFCELDRSRPRKIFIQVIGE
jgi:secondary thiamine-phosphate synthase enzyme